MKFYPRDWRGDQALRAVSISARGFWMECLCIMHEAKPYGHLVLNGSPVEGDTLSRMTGVSVDEVSALLAELRQAGVLSVTGKGVVFSRRMVADHARANKGRNAVNKRWRQTSVNTTENSTPNRSPKSKPTTQKPEARKESTSSLRSEDTFGAFWSAYPKRDGANPRKPAEDAFARALRRDTAENIIRGVRLYAGKNPNRSQFVAQAVTWLNQDRWRDEIEAAPPSTAGLPAGWPANFAPPERAREAYMRGFWPSTYGPQPGETGCQIPEQIQSEWLAEKAGKQNIAARVG